MEIKGKTPEKPKCKLNVEKRIKKIANTPLWLFGLCTLTDFFFLAHLIRFHSHIQQPNLSDICAHLWYSTCMWLLVYVWMCTRWRATQIGEKKNLRTTTTTKINYCSYDDANYYLSLIFTGIWCVVLSSDVNLLRILLRWMNSRCRCVNGCNAILCTLFFSAWQSPLSVVIKQGLCVELLCFAHISHYIERITKFSRVLFTHWISYKHNTISVWSRF